MAQTKSKIKKPTTMDLEQKFSETAFRLNQERNNFFLPQVQDFVLCNGPPKFRQTFSFS